MNLKDIQQVYFVGIGGIGMSALARYFHSRGVSVFGYDRTSTPLTKSLEAAGMQIHYDERIDLIPTQLDLVVYTPAIPDNHQEMVYFRNNKLPLKKRAEVLGIISQGMKTIGIAGTHGKTTTSTITTHLLKTGGVDCTAFLGGISTNYGSNFVAGNSPWVVIEADEFDRSFLQLSPDLAGILSMDADHLDIYGDHQSLLESGFKAFLQKIKPGGKAWVQHRFAQHFEDFPALESFGVDGGEIQITGIYVEDGYTCFDYQSPDHHLKDLRFTMPGNHNAENACLAISVALSLGVTESAIREGLRSFRGIQRRFELIYRDDKIVAYDDYAHHPTELKAAIQAARSLFPGKKITGVFQPHLFSRTRDFADDFANALDGLDELLLLEIYPAREKPIPGVSSQMLLERMEKDGGRVLQLGEAMEALKECDLEVLLTLGAGDISTLVPEIKSFLNTVNT